MNHLSPEEVANRRKELRQMRDLMFRNERKAKRIAKIKSKTYRRIRRKRVQKEAGADDGEESTSDVLDVEGTGHVDVLEKEELLRKKIQGQESDEEDADTEDAITRENRHANGEMSDKDSDKESGVQSDDETLANRPTMQRVGGRVVFTGAPSKTVSIYNSDYVTHC
jgi:U3 small nucleolar RNA-associated protein 14